MLHAFSHPFCMQQATDKMMQQRVAVALAWLGKEADLRQSFVDRRGLDVLLELLTDQRRDAGSHKEAAGKHCNACSHHAVSSNLQAAASLQFLLCLCKNVSYSLC